VIESVKKTRKILLTSDACERGSVLHTFASKITSSPSTSWTPRRSWSAAATGSRPADEVEDAFFPQPEGIGTVLAEELTRRAAAGELPTETVDYLDGGCGGMYLLHSMAGRRKVILIDCCLMGAEPGTLARFTPDDVQTVKKMAHLSLHEVDILKVIELARQIDQCPETIVIFGIEPVRIEPQMHINDTLRQRLPDYLDAITDELRNADAE
jgi:hydrogenase maturation protease